MNMLYLYPFMDMYNGEIISFRISKIASFKNVLWRGVLQLLETEKGN